MARLDALVDLHIVQDEKLVRERDMCDRAWRVLLNAVWMRVKLSEAEKLESSTNGMGLADSNNKKRQAGGGGNSSKADDHMSQRTAEDAGRPENGPCRHGAKKTKVSAESLDQPMQDGYASDVEFEEI
eukprot:scaffold237040_cov21-Prasinocladus_malaysianus.AAC.1